MKLPVSNPYFRLEWEIAVSLPPWPATLPAEVLIEEFGLRDVSDLRLVLKTLRKEGARVFKRRGTDAAVAYIDQQRWPSFRPLAQAYWERVHGTPSRDGRDHEHWGVVTTPATPGAHPAVRELRRLTVGS